MDHDRYLAYKSVLRSLERAPAAALDVHERERLRDTAEALLLNSDVDDAERLRRDAALALSMLVGQGRCDDLQADMLWSSMSDCGPSDPLAPAARERGLSFAGAL
jgi:hypothetical protein